MRKTNGAEHVKARAVVRCAIYTRKSTEEGLEQEFNSLDAQREAAEAFIASQRHAGWLCLRAAGGNFLVSILPICQNTAQGRVDLPVSRE